MTRDSRVVKSDETKKAGYMPAFLFLTTRDPLVTDHFSESLLRDRHDRQLYAAIGGAALLGIV